MTVTIHQAKTHLSRLLQHVAQGEEVIVCRGKQPIAKIVPTSTPAGAALRRSVRSSLNLKP